MTNPFEDKNLTRDRLKQLIASARQIVPQQEQEPVEAESFDWYKPHHFCEDNLAQFELFSRKLEKQIANTLDLFCQAGFEVLITSTDQYFADVLAADVQENKRGWYFLPFDIDGALRSGYLSFSRETALSLVGYMLRDPELGTGRDSELSDLEDSVLMDVVSAVLDAIGQSMKDMSGPEITRNPHFIKSEWPLSFVGVRDLFSVEFSASSDLGSMEMTLILMAEAMEPILGVEASTNQPYSQEQTTEIISRHIDEVPVEVTARLADGLISLYDMMNMEKDDVLVLRKKTFEPMEIMVNDHLCFRAYPARCSEMYAAIITD